MKELFKAELHYQVPALVALLKIRRIFSGSQIFLWKWGPGSPKSVPLNPSALRRISPSLSHSPVIPFGIERNHSQ